VIEGLEDQHADKISIYPNPTSGIVNLAGATNAHVTVYNTTGMIVADYPGLVGQSIDLSAQPNGIYFLKVSTEAFVTTKRISLAR